MATDPQDIDHDPYTEDPSTVIGRGSIPAVTNPPLALSCTFAAHELIAERYEVVQFLGSGAMGEVYEANDTALNLHVALKVIRPEIAADKRVVTRFLREIQLARRVTHPNVCRIFDIGTQRVQVQKRDGSSTSELTFLTMELLDGETLAQRLRRDGPLSTAEALPIIEQAAAGLQAAHHAGVVHRDLKCSNIMLIPVADGMRAVITDFGLAMRSDPSVLQSESISTVDEIVGTPAYMSPEQVRGENASAASDVYELGVVMFVMVTGRLPFEGHTPRLTALRRLEVDAPSPRMYVPDLDPNWERTIGRCLARDPKDRFRCATDVVRAVRGELDNASASEELEPSGLLSSNRVRWALAFMCLVVIAAIAVVLYLPRVRERLQTALGIVQLPAERQLAVLPFTALNGDQETGAFAKGLAETLASRLTNLTEKHSLQVIPTRELASNRVETVRQARQEFGVNLGLEGSVQQSGSMLRVSYQLVDAKTLRQVRADTITASASDPFALEDAVADSVARVLELELQPSERTALTSDRTTQPSAYDFYLQGRGYLQDFNKPAGLDSAITVFKSALALDSKYAPAYAGLGEAYWYRYEATHDPQWVRDATEECNRAVEYDDAGADGHICLGTIHTGSGEYNRAAQEFERALKLEPTSDDAVRGLALAYDKLNEAAKAEETYQQAIFLRPQYWRNYNMLGVFYYSRSRYDEAAKVFQQVIALAPDNYRGYSNLGGIYLLQGRYTEAAPLFQQALAIQPTADAYSNLGSTYYYLRDFQRSAAAFAEAVKRDDQDFVMWGNLANAEVRVPGRRSEAANAYRRAIGLAERDLQVNPRDTRVLADLADYYSMTGDSSKALDYIHHALALGSSDASVMFKAAQVYDQLGQTELAITCLLRALDLGYSLTMARDMPVFDNLRSDPRVRGRLLAEN